MALRHVEYPIVSIDARQYVQDGPRLLSVEPAELYFNDNRTDYRYQYTVQLPYGGKWNLHRVQMIAVVIFAVLAAAALGVGLTMSGVLPVALGIAAAVGCFSAIAAIGCIAIRCLNNYDSAYLLEARNRAFEKGKYNSSLLTFIEKAYLILNLPATRKHEKIIESTVQKLAETLSAEQAPGLREEWQNYQREMREIATYIEEHPKEAYQFAEGYLMEYPADCGLSWTEAMRLVSRRNSRPSLLCFKVIRIVFSRLDTVPAELWSLPEGNPVLRGLRVEIRKDIGGGGGAARPAA